mgnify:CR=1 FL=1
MIIVKTTIDDWSDLKAVRLNALEESPSAFGGSLENEIKFDDSRWQSRADGSNGTTFFLAYIEREAVGIAGSYLSDNGHKLISVWVSPTFRGKSVAVELVKSVQAYVINAGYTKLVLEIEKNNLAVNKFYLKCGFVPEVKPSNIMFWKP